MRVSDNRAIRWIVFMGVGAFVFSLLAAVGLKGMLKPGARPPRPVVAKKGASPFDSVRAYGDLRTIVGYGPRISGSKALGESRAFVERELGKAGLEVREQTFDAKTPIGPLGMVNVVGVVHGSKPGVIVLGNHYETKYFPNFTFVGANDGGSTTAWMIEMARTLGPHREGRSVWLCFFDGEEAFGEWSETDSLYGSRAFVEQLKKDGELAQVRAMINVDMIGDCYLSIKEDADAPAWLNAALAGTVGALGYGAYFPPFGESMEDDHTPFRRAGIPALEVIDFCYGRDRAEHARTWHTANDTLDRVCGESLQVVGDVIYHVLAKVDAHLDMATRAGGG